MPNSAMHPFCCVSSMANSNSTMPAAAQSPADPLSRIQNLAAISRASSARDSAADHGGGAASLSNSNGGNYHHGHNHSQSLIHPSRELKINDIVGDGVSGILYKWVNYGRGWRPRWFVLQDGVLSYYKIHGPDKIVVNQETERGSRVIGEESLRRVMGNHSNQNHYQRNGIAGSPAKNRKPVGEVHLKVSISFFLILDDQ